MNKKYLTLVSRIREELSEIKQAVDRAQTGWNVPGEQEKNFTWIVWR